MTPMEMVDKSATLNGNPAKISGYRNRFATVTDMTTRLSCEFAWETVERILTLKNGAFQS